MQTETEQRDGKGRLFIVSAPSGAGKTTICKALLDRFPDIRYSISHTTRSPREGEKEGVDYIFVSREEFLRGIEANQWAEWAEVHGNYYGTSADLLDRMIAEGRYVLLDVDVQGERQLVKRYPDSVTIFIMPPEIDELKARMEARGTDSPEVIARRLDNAKKEIACKDQYQHVIVNDDLDRAVQDIIDIVAAARGES